MKSGAMGFDINNRGLAEEVKRASEGVVQSKSPCIVIWISEASPTLRVAYGNAHPLDTLRMLAAATAQITDEVSDEMLKRERNGGTA